MKKYTLLEPGKYEFSYNQEYLLTKLKLLDVWTALFWCFWLCLFFGLAFYVCVKLVRFWNKDTESDYRAKAEKIEIAKCHDIFTRFHELCRLIYEDKYVFSRPEKMIEDMYYPELKELIGLMSLREGFMNRNYRQLIPDYKFYKNKLMKQD